MENRRKIAILGSTGSIGTQTLDIVRANKDLEVTALAAGSNVELLERQGTQVSFTDSFGADWRAPEYRRSVDITIKENGDVLFPGRKT